MMSSFDWLIEWFQKHCDGDWEHSYGIRIGTLDNPGWRISISLEETELEEKEFERLVIERTESDWIHCFVEHKCFEIACGINNFEEGIEIFKKWSEKKA